VRGRIVTYSIVIFIGCLAGRALMSKRMMAGHDSMIYMIRLAEYDDSVRYGIIAPRWAPHLGAGHGEPVWIFAPPLFQALCEIVHLAGTSRIVSENITLLILFLFAGCVMYLIGSNLGGPIGGIAGAVALFFAPYILVDLFVRHAAAEFCAFCFVPLIVLALQRLANAQLTGSIGILAFGVAAVGLAHNGVLLMTFPISLGVALLLFRRSASAGLSAMIGLLMGLGIAAWSWLPAMAERPYAHLDLLHSGFFDYARHFIGVSELVGIGQSETFGLTLGPLLIVLACTGVAFASTDKRSEIVVFAAIAIVGILLSTAMSAIVWKRVRLMQELAFPWRFLILPSVAMPPCVASSARRWPAATLAIVLLHAGLFLNHQRPKQYLQTTDADVSPVRIAEMGLLDTSQDEYRPRWAEVLLPFSPAAFDPPLPGRLLSYTPVDRAYAVEMPRKMTVRLQTFYFPGWSVRMDGDEIPIHPASHSGLIEFALPAGRHILEARFGPTPVRAASEVISLLALLAAVVLRKGFAKSAATPRGVES
jgi:hypothetical protein